MKIYLKQRINWLKRVFFILVSLFVFQSNIVAALASPINLGFVPHNPISKITTYDETESSKRVISDRGIVGKGDVSKVENGQGYDVLARELRVAAKASAQSFKSFSAFKSAMGPAGNGKAWHHIVEQNTANIAKFGPEAIHHTVNLMKLPNGAGTIHAKISGFYSSKQAFTGGQTVRQWLSTQSYQAQYDFGIKTLKQFGWTP